MSVAEVTMKIPGKKDLYSFYTVFYSIQVNDGYDQFQINFGHDFSFNSYSSLYVFYGIISEISLPSQCRMRYRLVNGFLIVESFGTHCHWEGDDPEMLMTIVCTQNSMLEKLCRTGEQKYLCAL